MHQKTTKIELRGNQQAAVLPRQVSRYSEAIFSHLNKAKQLFFMSCLLALNFATGHSQIVINEIMANGTVELKNIGTATVNIADYWLCDYPAYQQISNSNIICGDAMLEPGALLSVDDFNTINSTDGELGIYIDRAFSNPNSIIDYVEWGSTGHGRSNVAVEAGIWSTGDVVLSFNESESLSYTGNGDSPESWVAGDNTICEENGNNDTDTNGDAISLRSRRSRQNS